MPRRIVIITLAIGWLAALSPGYAGWPWGFDAWLWHGLRDFLPFQPRLIPLLVCSLMIFSLGLYKAERVCDRIGSEQIGVRSSLIMAAGGGLLLWLLRVGLWYGDLHNIDTALLPWWTFETAEPLGAWTTYLIQHGAYKMGIQQSTALAFVSVFCGACTVGAMWRWAGLISSKPVWPFLMLVSSGFMLIFCGYPEKGTPKSLALVALYVVSMTFVMRRKELRLIGLSSLLLSLAIVMHGSASFLLPAHLFVALHRDARPYLIRAGLAFAGPFLVISAHLLAGAKVAGGPWGNVLAPLQWLPSYCHTSCDYKFWSSEHFLDVLNCALILSPVATVMLPFLLKQLTNTYTRWLGINASFGFCLSILWNPLFGYLRDWDLFILGPFFASLCVITASSERLAKPAFERFALLYTVGTFCHTVSWWRAFQS